MADQAGGIAEHETKEQQDGERDSNGQRLGGSLTGAFILRQEEKCGKQAADNQYQNKNDSEFDEHESLPGMCHLIMRRT